MRNRKPAHIAITGASSGIGEQLALAYSRAGIRLTLAARRPELLDRVGQACRAQGAVVSTSAIDVRDEVAVCSWYEQADADQPIDLIIVNAGVFDGNGAGDAWETGQETRRLIEINLIGAIYSVQAAMIAMRRHGSGHIAVVSSLAAILPGADAPSYGASKAALVTYCDAIRMQLAPTGICVSTILPGHVRSAQTDVHVGPLEMIISASSAAAIIKRGLDRQKTYIAFPGKAHWLVRLGSLLPWRLKAWATKADRFYVRKDDKSGQPGSL